MSFVDAGEVVFAYMLANTSPNSEQSGNPDVEGTH